MRGLMFLVLMVSSLASANTPKISVHSFPGKVKVSVDLKMSTNELDVLFLIDNSGSMADHQSALAQYIPFMVQTLENANLNFHAGVITTDMIDPAGQGRLVGKPAFIDPLTPNGAQILQQNLLVGANGSAQEEMFRPIMSSLSEPLLSRENNGFYRPEADLALVALTDADDQGPFTSKEFVSFLKTLKGDLSRVKFAGLLVPTAETNCPRDDGPPTKLEEVVGLLSGIEFSLCSKTYEENIRQLSYALASSRQNPSHPTPAVLISRIPLPSAAAFDTITVNYGAQVLTRGDLTYGWAYDSKSNEILLGDKIEWTVQPRGTTLDVTYVPKDWVHSN